MSSQELDTIRRIWEVLKAVADECGFPIRVEDNREKILIPFKGILGCDTLAEFYPTNPYIYFGTTGYGVQAIRNWVFDLENVEHDEVCITNELKAKVRRTRRRKIYTFARIAKERLKKEVFYS